MKRNYKEFFKIGNAAQMKKLKQNEHKGELNISLKSGIDLIELEMVELFEAYLEFREDPTIEKLEAMKDEAADVMNFGGMIILEIEALKKLIKSQGEGLEFEGQDFLYYKPRGKK